MSGVSALDATTEVRAGLYASLVDAGSVGYLLPTFDPDRTTPPGNGMITFGTCCIAATAAAAAPSAASMSCARRSRLPPPTALTTGVVSWQTNSPSMTGTRQ